jgi:hypothetical protein
MLKALRKRAMRAYAIFFVAGGALCIALKKLFNDKFAEDESVEQQALKQQQEQQHQLQPRLVGYSLGNEQSSTPSGRDGSDLEREYREFQEFKSFQEQKRLREQQQAVGVSSSKAP